MKFVLMFGLVTALFLQGTAPADRQHARTSRNATAPTPQLSAAGAIRGRAVEVGTGRPMRRVVVSGIADHGQAVEVTTGADGRFELGGLRAGRYTIRADRSGYLASPARARRLSPRPMPIDVLASETVDNVDFKLVRAGAISGRIVDDAGDAVIGARVTACRWSFADGGRRLEVAAASDTDDLGEYRLSDLSAGSYRVSAMYAGADARIVGRRGGSREPGVLWAYYPGVPVAAQAQLFSIREGSDVRGADFALLRQRCPPVSGSVADQAGRPVIGAWVSVNDADAESLTKVGASAATRPPDGVFRFEALCPGEYLLAAHLLVGRGGSVELAVQSVIVGGEAVSNLRFVTVRGEPLRGRITSDADPSGFTADNLRVRLAPVEDGGSVDRLVPMSGSVRPDWTFEVARRGGLRLVQVEGLPAAWAVKAVTVGKRTSADALVEIDPSAPIANLTITLTHHPPELSGEVLGPADERVLDYAVVAFAREPWRWPFVPRFVQLERPNQEGRFRIRGLAPGPYLLAAVEDVDDATWRNPEFLERLRPFATPVTVTEGTSASLALRLVGEEWR